MKGVPADAKAKVWIHDHTRDFVSAPVQFADGKVTLDKVDSESAAFLVEFWKMK